MDRKCAGCNDKERPAPVAVRILSDSEDKPCLYCRKLGHSISDCDYVPREMNSQKPTFCLYCESSLHDLDECQAFVEGIRRVNSDSFLKNLANKTAPMAPINIKEWSTVQNAGNIQGGFDERETREAQPSSQSETETTADEESTQSDSRDAVDFGLYTDNSGAEEQESRSKGLSEISSVSEKSSATENPSVLGEIFENDGGSQRKIGEELEESWLDHWIDTSNARETWVNIHKMTDEKIEFQKSISQKIQKKPAECPRLYHSLLKQIQIMWTRQATVKWDSDEFRKNQEWAAGDSLVDALAKLERKFGKHTFSVWKERMLQVFNENLPGYQWTVQMAFADKIRGRYGIYRKLTDFHSYLQRAVFAVENWPVGWDARAWVLVASEGDGSVSTPHSQYSGTELRPNVMLVELKTGSYRGETIGAGLPVGFFENQKVRFPDENETVLAQRLICTNNDLTDVHRKEKYQVLEVTEFWFNYLETEIRGMGLTLARLLEKTWFRVHVWDHLFTQGMLHVFDVRHEIQENPDSPEAAHLFERAKNWYASSVFFIGLADLKVVEGNLSATFLNFVTEVLGGNFDGRLTHFRMLALEGCEFADVENFRRKAPENPSGRLNNSDDVSQDDAESAWESSSSPKSAQSVGCRENCSKKACIFEKEIPKFDSKSTNYSLNDKKRVILSVELVVKPVSEMLENPLVLGTLFCYDCENDDCEVSKLIPKGALKIFASEQKLLDETEEVSRWVHRFRPDELWLNGRWSPTSADLLRVDLSRVNDEDPYRAVSANCSQSQRVRLRNRSSLLGSRDWGATYSEFEGTEWLAAAMRIQGQLYDESIGVKLVLNEMERKRVLRILLDRVCKRCVEGLPNNETGLTCGNLKWLVEQTEIPNGRRTTLTGARWGGKQLDTNQSN